MRRRKPRPRHRGFSDIVLDPVLGTLAWQGYGDGDWWSAPVAADGRVEIRLEGFHAPYPELVARAGVLAGAVVELQARVTELVRDRLDHDPDRAAELRRLRLHAIVVFRPDPGDPEGYAGEFLILRDPGDDGAEEWRVDLTEGGPGHLRPW